MRKSRSARKWFTFEKCGVKFVTFIGLGLALTENAKVDMYAAQMFLPGFIFRMKYATSLFLILFDFISDWFSTGRF